MKHLLLAALGFAVFPLFAAESGHEMHKAAASKPRPPAAQPQLAVANDGRVWLVRGQGSDLFVARSDDGGRTFAAAAEVASVPKLMLGLRRGPRIAAHGDRVTVTAIGEELVAFTSTDAGRTWSGPVTVNDAPASAREGLHDLAGGPRGELFATWLDLRHGPTELWSATSRDGGRTWAANERVYRSPERNICECCHPSALFDAEGNLAVMWRNFLDGSRDMWMATRAAGAAQFGAARKLGEGTWKLNACPMDGGRIVALGAGKFGAVWQRNNEVFFSDAEAHETRLGPGKQPVATLVRGEPVILWQQGPDLMLARGAKPGGAAKHAGEARFATLVPAANGHTAILAYEQGAGEALRVVTEQL